MFVSPNQSKKLPKSSQNSPKTLSKPSRNPSKTLPKPFQNPPKTLPEASLRTEPVPKSTFFRIFAILLDFFRFFIDFLSPRGLPKSSQNHEKSQINAKKSMSKKHMVFNTIFSRFFSVWASENGAKIEIFSLLFRKRRFCKIRAPVEAKLLFFRF